MKNVKQIIYTSLAARKRLKERTGYDHKEYFKNKDTAFKELMTSIKNVDLSQNMKLKDRPLLRIEHLVIIFPFQG